MERRFFTQSDKVTMEQAAQALEKKLDRARNTILGGNISFLPLLTDADGRLSDERIEALAADMVRALRECVTPYGEPEPCEIPQNYRLENNFIVPEESAPPLGAGKEELNKSFVYCAVCVAASLRYFGGTFGDILDIAANQAYTAESEYRFSTADSLELFGNLAACALGTDVLSGYYEKTSVIRRAKDDETAYNAAESGKKAIPDPEKFISEFKKYVKLNNTKFGGSGHIAERGDMVMTYLYKKGFTVLALGDDYSAVENIVDNFRSAIEAECSYRTHIEYV